MKRAFALAFALFFVFLLSGCTELELWGMLPEGPDETEQPALTSAPAGPQASEDTSVVDFIFGTDNPSPQEASPAPQETIPAPQTSEDTSVVDFIFGTDTPPPQAASPEPQETVTEEISPLVQKLALDAISVADQYISGKIDYLAAYEQLCDIDGKLEAIYMVDGKYTTILIDSEVVLMASNVHLKKSAETIMESVKYLENMLLPNSIIMP